MNLSSCIHQLSDNVPDDLLLLIKDLHLFKTWCLNATKTQVFSEPQYSSFLVRYL